MATVERLVGDHQDLQEADARVQDADRAGSQGHARRDGPSVLYSHARGRELKNPPAYFRDLNLDQVVDAITARWEEYDLGPILYTPLGDVEAINYRQDVMRDVEREDIGRYIARFGERMRRMRGHIKLVGKLYYKRQREVWYLEAIATYCQAVRDFSDDLTRAEPSSRGLGAIGEYLSSYVRSSDFLTLTAETEKLTRALGEVRYTMTLKASSIRVSGYDVEVEADYGAQVEETFERFRQDAPKDHRVRFADLLEMGHVEAAVLEFVAKFHPELFGELAEYCDGHGKYLDPVLATFDREIQFYVAYLSYIEPIKAVGLNLCYPEVSDSRDVSASETFDLALARKLTEKHTEVICNDWHLSAKERIFAVSGPNQGGKTTFARTFGQLHHLAAIGCPVPGAQARLLLFDQLLSHFEKQEDLSNSHGKLEDDLIRVHEILERATARTIIVINESFTSTTLDDARFLGGEILNRMIALDLLAIYVTFVDELASLGDSVVSVTSTVDQRDPTIRTFKIVRRPADGLAYAAAIAEKYKLTYDLLKQRVGS